MILAIVFAELWAVCQLIVLGTFTRTVRVRTVFMALAVGLYACAPLALLLQVTWIRAAAWLSGTPAYQLVGVAAYTADPFIEEIVKVLPVAMLLTIPAIRRQWSITDCVLLGAACGAGFGLAEELYRFGTVSTSALFNARFGGWMLPGIAATPTVPSLSTTVTSWLPPGVLPNELLTLSLNHYPAINLHLAWSSVGGLAVGLMWLRRERVSRIAGAILLLYVAIDHALNNAQVSTGFSLLRNSLAVMPVVALGIGWWFDRRSQSASDEPLLAAEQAASWRLLGTLQVAVSRLPGSLSRLYGFVRIRRANNSALAAGHGDPEGLRAAVVDARDRLERDLVEPQSPPWLPIGWTRSNVFAALRRPAVILWLVLMTPSFLWFVVGGWPQTAAVQTMMAGPIAWKAVLVLSVVAQAWLAWQVIIAVRAWPTVLRLPIGDDAAMFGLRMACGVGAVTLGAFALMRGIGGLSPERSLFRFHVLEAFDTATALAALQLANAAAAGAPPPLSPAHKGPKTASPASQPHTSALDAIAAAVANDAPIAAAQSLDAPELTPDELAAWAADGDTREAEEFAAATAADARAADTRAADAFDAWSRAEKAMVDQAKVATEAGKTGTQGNSTPEERARFLEASRALDEATTVENSALATQIAADRDAAAAHARADVAAAERASDQAHEKYESDLAVAQAADAAAIAADPDAAPHAARDVSLAATDTAKQLQKALADAKQRASGGDPDKKL
jgi:hypothetical protein